MDEKKKNSVTCLSADQIEQIVNRYKNKESITSLSKEYQVHRRTIDRYIKKEVNNSDIQTKNGELSLKSPCEENSIRKKQNNLSLKDKGDIIEALNRNIAATDLAEQYNVSVMTIYRLKNNKTHVLQDITQTIERGGSLDRKIVLKEESLVDQALFKWFEQARAANQPISGAILRLKAKQIHEKFGNNTFKFSVKWLDNFKSRHGIHQVTMHGEKLSADAQAAEKFFHDINELIRTGNYKADCIYNADETGLMYKLLPDKTLILRYESNASGQKVLKDRVTVMFCANASGSHKIPLLIIGKSERPMCFRKLPMSTFPFFYMGQKKAWINRQLFVRWYKEIFLPEIYEKHPDTLENPRKILLILDNAPSHPSETELNAIDPTVKVKFLLPNITSLQQPMDQGIIEKTKRLYKNTLLRQLVISDNQEDNVLNKAKKITMRDCGYLISSAWKEVTPENIQRAWNNLLKNKNWNISNEAGHRDVEELLHLIKKIPGYSDCTFEQAKTWIEIDYNECGWKVYTPEEVLDRVIRGNYDDTNESDNEDGYDSQEDQSENIIFDEGPDLTDLEAVKFLERFKTHAEEKWDFTSQDLLNIEKLRDKSLHYCVSSID